MLLLALLLLLVHAVLLCARQFPALHEHLLTLRVDHDGGGGAAARQSLSLERRRRRQRALLALGQRQRLLGVAALGGLVRLLLGALLLQQLLRVQVVRGAARVAPLAALQAPLAAVVRRAGRGRRARRPAVR